MLTNSGRNFLADQRYFVIGSTGGNTGFMATCLLGTGSSAPAPTDTYLANKVSVATQASQGQVGTYTQYSSDPANGVWWVRRKFQFSELVANYSLAEVGLCSYSPYGSANAYDETNSNSAKDIVNTRALFRDANGSPITITKTSQQILTITATVYLTRGSVDANMALVDGFFGSMVQGISNPQYVQWQLGSGSSDAPANTDSGLRGTQLASKPSSGQTQWMWDGSGWLSSWTGSNRPAAKLGISPFSIDWDLGEANGTFNEVVASFYTGGGYVPIVRILFPCGTVTAQSYTKTNQVKLRQYFELVWG
ncbi:MAG: hypothetical protein IRZ03_17465 [Acidobacterium ailaaui]|nr:hypothetical protein [Pseudacidobacterium ailaaui]